MEKVFQGEETAFSSPNIPGISFPRDVICVFEELK